MRSLDPDRGSMRPRPAALVAAAAFLLVLVLVLSACGGGGSSTTAGSTGAEESGAATETESGSEGSSGEGATAAAPEEEAKGAPIKTMFTTPIQSQATPTFVDAAEASVAFEKWTNAHGGIGGRPIKITICDDRGETTQAATCARQAVEEKDVAVIGSFSFFGETIVPILEKGNVAWFGTCCATSAAELKSDISFPVGSQPAYAAAMVAKAFEEGCETFNAVIIEGTQPIFEPVMKNAAKALGKEVGKFVNIPAAAKDESPVVAEALSGGADCVGTIMGESLYKAWMGPWVQSGTEARMYGIQGNLNAQALEGFEEAGEGDVITGIYADWKTPLWKEYREALEFSGAEEGLDYGSVGAQGAWAGDLAFKKIVESMKGPVTNETFIEAASKTSHLSTGGLTPILNFTKDWHGVPGFERLFNRSVAFSKYEHGEVVPEGEELYDATALMEGKGKLGAGEVPK